MPIELEVNGTSYTNFTRAGVSLALDTMANDFSFETVMPAGEQLPRKGGDECSVIVDGELVLTGGIENITGRYTAEQHSISVTGRDRTKDFIDSSISAIDDMRAPITLKQIIEKVVAHIGSDLSVVDLAALSSFNKAEDIVTPQPGENAFQFVEGYAQKRQVLLTSNAAGDIVITNSKATPSGGVLQNELKSTTNNILESSWSYMTGNLFNKYIQKGQLDPVALNIGASTSAEGVISQLGETTDTGVRAGRQLVMLAAKGFSKEQLQTRAEWSKKIRQARSVAYSCTVQGFRNSAGNLWTTNTLVSIFDVFADIDRDLLLNSIQFMYSTQTGSTTLLGFVEAGAYELQPLESVSVGSNQDVFIL